MAKVQIQISWLLQKPTDFDLHCLQRQDISGFSRTRVNVIAKFLCMICTSNRLNENKTKKCIKETALERTVGNLLE